MNAVKVGRSQNADSVDLELRLDVHVYDGYFLLIDLNCNLTILNRLRLRPPHPAMDQLVQDFNTALDETAGSGSARSVLFTRF